jgi:hypothetical protein
VSDRDARLLAQRLDEMKEHLAENSQGGELCEAARARVADDLELVTAALERSHRPAA